MCLYYQSSILLLFLLAYLNFVINILEVTLPFFCLLRFDCKKLRLSSQNDRAIRKNIKMSLYISCCNTSNDKVLPDIRKNGSRLYHTFSSIIIIINTNWICGCLRPIPFFDVYNHCRKFRSLF